MAKYDNQTLKNMSEVLLECKERGDLRFHTFVAAIALKARVKITYVIRMIHQYAQ